MVEVDFYNFFAPFTIPILVVVHLHEISSKVQGDSHKVELNFYIAGNHHGYWYLVLKECQISIVSHNFLITVGFKKLLIFREDYDSRIKGFQLLYKLNTAYWIMQISTFYPQHCSPLLFFSPIALKIFIEICLFIFSIIFFLVLTTPNSVNSQFWKWYSMTSACNFLWNFLFSKF